jgi:hypothetical protein
MDGSELGSSDKSIAVLARTLHSKKAASRGEAKHTTKWQSAAVIRLRRTHPGRLNGQHECVFDQAGNSCGLMDSQKGSAADVSALISHSLGQGIKD